MAIPIPVCGKSKLHFSMGLLTARALLTDAGGAIRHCHAYVETFLNMCTTAEFRPFYCLCRGTYQPLQATAILLDDVLNSPFSEETLHSRVLVEKLFSFVGLHGMG